MYFRYFIIISPWKWAWPFICSNLNSLHPRMLCAKFGWNWSSGSWEEDENVKSLRRRQRPPRRTTDQIWSEKLTWAFGWSELIKDENVTEKRSDDRRSEQLTWALSSVDLKTVLLLIYVVKCYNKQGSI